MTTPRTLKISFHGRIIEQLGIQMYQKPVAAISEMISNAWDADATFVKVRIPDTPINSASTIKVVDNGNGMTFTECEEKFLNVGRSRRGDNPDETSPNGRPILGRKGIGKFAGFGISSIIEVDTISRETGEHVVFELNLDNLIGEEYISTDGTINVTSYSPPDDARKSEHGTSITLKNLKLNRRPNLDVYLNGMSRRFLLAQRSDDFLVTINDQELPDISPDVEGIEFVLPEIYTDPELASLLTPPEALVVEDGWAKVQLPSGNEIRWKLYFYKKPIQDEELRGVSIYSKGKLSQSSFFFNLTGGLSGQHGQQYLSGQIEADFVDSLDQDLISPERQRINWQNPALQELEDWGQAFIRKALIDWKKLRQKEKTDLLTDRVENFSDRLDKMQPHERKTIESAISKVAGVDSIDEDDFVEIGDAMLTAWEKGRLKELIQSFSRAEDLEAEDITSILLEARVLSALSTSEAIKTRLEAIEGLRRRVADQEPENAVRDYIASDAWIISPELEFYDKERRVTNLLDQAKSESRLEELDGYRGRVDLVLSHENKLVVIEFMRPGVPLDWDHVDRFKRYVNILKNKILSNTALGITEITGYIVADRIERSADVSTEIRELAEHRQLFAMDWQTLIRISSEKWKLYLESIVSRTPEDIRLQNLLD